MTMVRGGSVEKRTNYRDKPHARLITTVGIQMAPVPSVPAQSCFTGPSTGGPQYVTLVVSYTYQRCAPRFIEEKNPAGKKEYKPGCFEWVPYPSYSTRPPILCFCINCKGFLRNVVNVCMVHTYGCWFCQKKLLFVWLVYHLHVQP